MRSRWLVASMVFGLVLTACGTRVPDDEFALFIEGTGGEGATSVDGGELDGDLAVGGDLDALDDDGGASVAEPGDAGDEGGGGGGGQAAAQGGASSGGGDEQGGNGGGGGSGDEPNRASDVGVTEDTITVGNLVSMGGPLGRDAFAPSYFGANAYFTYLNQAKGGVHGRTVEFEMCDDAEDPSRNQSCAQQLVEQQEVFAFVANATRAYAGARYVSEQGVPDILGQPVGNEYWTYPTLYSIRSGGGYPRDGSIGVDGELYGGTLAFDYVREEFDARTAAVFYFSVPISRAFGQHNADGLREQGFEVLEFEVNPVAPNFAARVQQMQQAGVDVISDAMDVNANRNLCRAMDDAGFQVDVKLTTTQGMSRGVRDYSHPCRESLLAISESLPYSEDSNDEVALFQDVMSRVYGGQFDGSLAQWAWEGWVAARSFTQAVETMGPAPTREGLMAYYDRQDAYTSDGLLSPVDWQVWPFGQRNEFEQCMVASQWDEGEQDFVRRTPYPFCKVMPYLPWSPA